MEQMDLEEFQRVTKEFIEVFHSYTKLVTSLDPPDLPEDLALAFARASVTMIRVLTVLAEQGRMHGLPVPPLLSDEGIFERIANEVFGDDDIREEWT